MVSRDDDDLGYESDLERVRAALAGDRDAVETLLDRLRCVRKFVSYRNARLGSPLAADEVEDTVQETLFAVWRKLSAYEGAGAFEAWVYRFAFLEVQARVRKRRSGPLRLEQEELLEERAEEGLDADYERLYRVLETLGPPSAPVIRLKHLEALTFDEIAERLAITPSTAKTHYYRGLEVLRKMLQPFDTTLLRRQG